MPVARRVEQCRRYLAAVEEAVSGKGGHDATFRVARLIVNDFAVPEEEAWELLEEYNEGCEPPWSDAELDHKLDDALAAPDDDGIRFSAAAHESRRSFIGWSVSDCVLV